MTKPPAPKQVRISKLKLNDWFICPATGRPERVTMSRRAGTMPGDAPRWFVRTNHHDHYRLTTDMVTLAETPEWARPKLSVPPPC